MTEEYLKKAKESFEAALYARFDTAHHWDERLWQAMKYSISAGGKRIRPLFMQLAYEACGGTEPSLLLPFQLAIEMIHTYSLIHDDLPAMDDDEYRRGRLTCHKAFDEAAAILAGDGLLNLAFETILTASTEAAAGKYRNDPLVLGRLLRAASILADAAGPSGMVSGQTADLLAEQQTATREHLEYIEAKKTGCLICASLMCGAELAGASEEQKKALYEAGRAYGKAFQIQDDILDIEGDMALLGKATGQDAKMEKVTFVTIYGMEKAKETVRELCEEAQRSLEILDHRSGEILRTWIHTMIERKQ